MVWVAIPPPAQPASVVVAGVTHFFGTPDPAPNLKKTKCDMDAGLTLTAEACETSDQEPDAKKTKCGLEGGGLRDGRSRAGSVMVSHSSSAVGLVLACCGQRTPPARVATLDCLLLTSLEAFARTRAALISYVLPAGAREFSSCCWSHGFLPTANG